jgi:hypothetical protein
VCGGSALNLRLSWCAGLCESRPQHHTRHGRLSPITLGACANWWKRHKEFAFWYPLDVDDPFSIDLNIQRSPVDPGEISKAFSLDPDYSWKRGDSFAGLLKTSTQWYGRISEGHGIAEYASGLESLIAFVTQHDQFIAEELQLGAEIEVVLNHPTAVGSKGIVLDLQLSPLFLERLSQNGIGLRIRAWNDNPEWASER